MNLNDDDCNLSKQNTIKSTCGKTEWIIITLSYPRELTSVGRDIVYYMQGSGFEPQTPHFSTIKLYELYPLGYLTKKKNFIFNLEVCYL